MNVQMELQQKVNTSHNKELQYILAVFEKILTLLPEFIHKRWQYNCIINIIKSLIHPNNTLKIRSQGIQLFILWFQILGLNAPKSCYDMFISLVPNFEPIIKANIYTNLTESINEMEMKPVLTHNIEKEPEIEDIDKYILQCMLRYMVSEGIKVEWNDKKDGKQLQSYTFMFDQFKEYFLPVIFSKCSSDYTIEKNMNQSLVTAEFLEFYTPALNSFPIDAIRICQYQAEVIRWMKELICTEYPKTFSNTDSSLKHSDTIEEDKKENVTKPVIGQNQLITSDIVCLKFDRDNTNVKEMALKKILQILFQNEENVNIINQLCQHALYLPLQFYKTHISVISIYRSWLFSSVNKELSYTIDTDSPSPVVMRCISNVDNSAKENKNKVFVSHTIQRVIFTNVAFVFLHKYKESKNETKLPESNSNQIHCDLVKSILSDIYQKSVNDISNLDYEHLMNVLLDISFNVLSSYTPSNRPKNHWISNDESIRQLFSILNALLIKSSLSSYISEQVWNRYLQINSSFVEWIPIVTEWKITIENILRLLGKTLYNVDMNDLPLEKKMRRGRLVNNLKRSNSSKLVKRIFSSDDNSINTGLTMYQNKSNTMSCNLSLRNKLYSHTHKSFTENQTSDEPRYFQGNLDNDVLRSDIGDLETKKKLHFEDSNENYVVSYDSSSHEENSSYMSAEESSSPHSFKSAVDHFYTSSHSTRYINVRNLKNYSCKDKALERSSGLLSDNELLQFSFSVGDISQEMYISDEEGNEDNNVDADDEYENEINNNIFSTTFDDDSTSVTLTRSDSDVDIPPQSNRISDQRNLHDASKMTTKYSTQERYSQVKDKNRNIMTLDDQIVNAVSTEVDFSNQVQSSENSNCRHVSLVGIILEQNHDSVVLLWKRLIGLLGNITKITNSKILLIVLDFFSDLTNSLIKMRENMCVPTGNQASLKPPMYVPPIDYIMPWMFEVFTVDTIPDDVKIVALQILCRITVRKMDIQPSINHLVQFYNLIHSIIYNENMVFICALIGNLGVYLFSMPLPGLEILILDIIKACEMILERSVLKPDDFKTHKLPKVEAISILGSLLVLKDHYGTIKTFDPKSKNIHIIDSTLYKKDILRILTFNVLNEPISTPRALSIINIALYCYTQMLYTEISPDDLNDVRQSILLLLRMIRFNNYEIATISIDMIRFLVTIFPQIHEKLPHIPEKIIQALSWTINGSMQRHKGPPNYGLKKCITTMIFTLVDWCMNLPLNQLLDSDDLHPRGLIHLAFSALENILKYDDFSDTDNYSSTSHLKLNLSERNQNVELRRPLALITDPLIGFSDHFEIQPTQENDFSNIPNISINNAEYSEQIKLSAQTALCHLINHIGQFPMNNVLGCLSSCVQEHHDFKIDKVKRISDNPLENTAFDELSTDVFNSSDLQLFVVNGAMIVSLLTINSNVQYKSALGGPQVIRDFVENTEKEPEIRIIIRDISGKYCWDVNFVHTYDMNVEFLDSNFEKNPDSIPPSPPPRRTLPPVLLLAKLVTPNSFETDNVTNDRVDSLIGDLISLSPELFPSNFNKLYSTESSSNVELIVRQQIQDQTITENNYFDANHWIKIAHPKFIDNKLKSNITIEMSPDKIIPNSKFYFCRQILNHLGFLSLKHRATIDLIQKSNIYRDLKCIDSLRSRETHKIAVLYVAWGQEDKESILGNVEASLEFNNFISGLGWTVDLETHKGFMGGLESNGKNGKYAPYYANSTLEIIFHVSTLMQSSSAEDKPNKFIHLGNDEVMVIWSENYRNFRSNITQTEFGDVMIIIYPLRSGLFGITIENKGELKLFGPLFDGAIVGEKELPGLIRTTAINAGRSIRESKPHYEDYFLERANYMQKAIKKFMEPTTFETFAANIYGTPDCPPDEPVVDTIHGAASLENNKRTSFKTTDLSSSSTILESTPSVKSIARLSTSPKTNRKFEDITDHIFHRKSSKVNRHLK